MLVNCVAYQDGKKLATIGIDEIHNYTVLPDCFVWVAVKDPEPAEMEKLGAEFDLHELAVEDAQHGHQRPKLEEYGQSIFVVLHMVEMKERELTVGEVAIFVGLSHVVSVRRGTERGFVDVRSRTEHEPELLRHGSGYVLYALMDAVVDRYFPVLDELTREFEEIEERLFAGQATRANIEALYGLKQKLLTMKHAAEPLLEMVGKLYGGRVPQLCIGLQDYFRDVYDHVVRLNHSIDTLRETMTTAISVNLTLIQIQENEVVKRLAAYASLIAVPTMIAGVYGMNFRFMPELTWRAGYPLSLGIMLGIDVYLWYRFRKAKWL
jgi:magnesium transporter